MVLEPYKFVDHDILPLSALTECATFKLRSKLNNGDKLTREEKDSLFFDLSINTYSKTGVPRLGWMFPFGDCLKAYYVEFSYGHIEKVYAPDKTSIRNHLWQ